MIKLRSPIVAQPRRPDPTYIFRNEANALEAQMNNITNDFTQGCTTQVQAQALLVTLGNSWHVFTEQTTAQGLFEPDGNHDMEEDDQKFILDFDTAAQYQ